MDISMNASQPFPAQPAIIEIRALRKTYEEAGQPRLILDTVDLDIYQGEFFVLLGISGSGKSTLLNLIGGIDQADGGSIVINGTDITRLNDRQLTLFRRDHTGIIFQFFNLIPTLTVLENVMLPEELRGDRSKQAQERGREMLHRVGLAGREATFPDKLSGGEQQRVAIARALATGPDLILADEPTGNLDEETGQHVLELLLELTRDTGKTLVMATHNPEIVPLADRVCRIHEGRLFVSSPQQSKEYTR
ncbi:MAG: ABC transporter ATP-binding protein [Anaerolineae bacterium]|nr:ABC transporter ATP-binding protein [Anaerolineae bacterium]